MKWNCTGAGWAVGLFLFLGTSACRSPQGSVPEEMGFYERLDSWAQDPALRQAVCRIMSDDRHPEGKSMALRWRGDDNKTVRASCYRWLLQVDRNRGGDWLEEGLLDSSVAVRVACLLNAKHVPEWSEAAEDAVWEILNTTRRGHVFAYASRALADRFGREGVVEIWDVVSRRGLGWEPFAIEAMCRYPEPEYRAMFERLASSDDADSVCLAERALALLDDPELDAPLPCLSLGEFHSAWDQEIFRQHEPAILSRSQFTQRLREARLIVMGELHAWVPARGAQIEVLAELAHFAGDRLVLVCELPVLEYQNPVLEAAKQYAVEVRMLEEEAMASNGTPSERDDFARQRLAEMLTNEPDRVFLVCYGDNHRVSLQQVAKNLAIPSMGIATHPNDGMLASAMRKTGGPIEGLCFAYPEDNYYLACGSFASILGCPELDDVLGGVFATQNPE